MGLFDKLKQGLQKTTQQLRDRLDRLDELVGLGGPDAGPAARQIDVDTADALEEILLMADVGVAATGAIVSAVSKRQRRGESLRELVKQEMLRVLESSAPSPQPPGRPHVVLIVGVNGVGKTTTIGKLANQMRQQGQAPLICAADTFRAAAVDQLQIWADRAGVDIVRAKEGSDTAGRLHTRTNLMNELDKIRRIAGREVSGAPHEVLLVLDATVGQNGIAQAREFTSVAGVTGIVLTKLDGTAKGGIALAIRRELGLPIKLVGLGETADDLVDFDPDEFVDALFS
jgi:fused signal recognition particle receptor